jgi:hypothetical protein
VTDKSTDGDHSSGDHNKTETTTSRFPVARPVSSRLLSTYRDKSAWLAFWITLGVMSVVGLLVYWILSLLSDI